MLHVVFPMHDLRGSQMSVKDEVVYKDQQGPTKGSIKFYVLLKDANKPLYGMEGCTKHSKSLVV